MLHYSDHFRLLEEKSGYPLEAKNAFDAVARKLDEKPDFGTEFDKLLHAFLFPKAHDLRKCLEKVSTLAEEHGVNPYTLHFVFLMCASETLLERYRKAGLPENIYWDTMDDLRCKLLECMACEEVPGTFVGDWYEGFFELERFACGRFQYEFSDFPRDYTAQCGLSIKEGQKCLNFHIPSSGISLTDAVRLDSYRKAYAFFPDYVEDGKLLLVCNSWLLFPKHREFLPEGSHILRFMDDFEIFDSHESDTFSNGWRVFGKDSDLPVADLPEKTRLQRAYKSWLLQGNKAGGGSGLIVFDGEKILR